MPIHKADIAVGALVILKPRQEDQARLEKKRMVPAAAVWPQQCPKIQWYDRVHFTGDVFTPDVTDARVQAEVFVKGKTALLQRVFNAVDKDARGCVPKREPAAFGTIARCFRRDASAAYVFETAGVVEAVAHGERTVLLGAAQQPAPQAIQMQAVELKLLRIRRRSQLLHRKQ